MADLILVRSDAGDGGWSLHDPDAEPEPDGEYSGDDILLTGTATWDDQFGTWDRPNADDYAAAERLRRAAG